MTPEPNSPLADNGFLPDFCRGSAVFNAMALAELLAIVISIVGQRFSGNIFKDLFLLSIYVQWIALGSAAAMCLSRKYLNRLPPLRAVLMAYLVLLCVAWAVGEITVWVMWAAGMIASPRPDWYLYFQVQNLTVCAIIDALALRYFLARHQLRQTAKAEAHARMEALKYRIRPHFLFNSMNIIASLTRRAPAKAEAAIEDMADVFRLMLDDTKNLVPLKSEIAVAKKYLTLEKLRLDDRLSVDWNVGRIPRTTKSPVLMLQLLLENAIYFGIEPTLEGGSVGIDIGVDGDTLTVSVSNPLPAKRQEHNPRDSTTLENIRQRLAAHYGDSAVLSAGEREGRFVVEIRIPAYGGTE
jgi:two-component system sensor histidine kinase AlgZ